MPGLRTATDRIDTMTVETVNPERSPADLALATEPCRLESVAVIPVGKVAGWLDFERQADSVVLRPVEPMPRP